MLQQVLDRLAEQNSLLKAEPQFTAQQYEKLTEGFVKQIQQYNTIGQQKQHEHQAPPPSAVFTPGQGVLYQQPQQQRLDYHPHPSRYHDYFYDDHARRERRRSRDTRRHQHKNRDGDRDREKGGFREEESTPDTPLQKRKKQTEESDESEQQPTPEKPSGGKIPKKDKKSSRKD
jgi:hypothetical protein